MKALICDSHGARQYIETQLTSLSRTSESKTSTALCGRSEKEALELSTLVRLLRIYMQQSLTIKGIDLETHEQVAIKLERMGNNTPTLEHEAHIYDALAHGAGISRVHCLEDLFNFCDRKFSIKTILLLFHQLISRIEYVHKKCFIHRDIKPENLLMGSGKLGNLVHIIDFNNAKMYRDPETYVHRAYHENCIPGGTSRYASINNHLGREQSRRDDLESLGYVIIYFALGSLPWQGLKAATEDKRNELIKEKKLSISIKDLCADLPEEFSTYLKYVRSLRFEDTPDYSHLRKLLRDLFVRSGFEYDNVFDWTVERFFMTHGNSNQLAAGIDLAGSQNGDGEQIPLAPNSSRPKRARRVLRPMIEEVLRPSNRALSPTDRKPVLVNGKKPQRVLKSGRQNANLLKRSKKQSYQQATRRTSRSARVTSP
ncbi:hypothetical protein B7494_g90 [Chlorociboria aeruginascens]|nr:hypothetical protein B7494_g90 [Chlorociboria aeruginascens]